jgi:hypothetical protein
MAREIPSTLSTQIFIHQAGPVLTGNESPDWRSESSKPMFGIVNLRRVRSLIYVLVAGQLLLSAPIVTAMAPSTSGAAEMPCADSMQKPDDSKPCPCCPDGTASMAACLSACAATVAAPLTLSIQVSRVITMPAIAGGFSYLAELADPPLKPPPIV